MGLGSVAIVWICIAVFVLVTSLAIIVFCKRRKASPGQIISMHGQPQRHIEVSVLNTGSYPYTSSQPHTVYHQQRHVAFAPPTSDRNQPIQAVDRPPDYDAVMNSTSNRDAVMSSTNAVMNSSNIVMNPAFEPPPTYSAVINTV